MYHIIYISSAVRLLSNEELFELLKKSRKYNSVHNITGCLFYKDGNFLQIIEGDKADVEFLFEKIKKDQIHKGIIILFEEKIQSREFPQWEMAFHNFNNDAENIPEGFLDLFSNYLNQTHLSHHSEKIDTFIKLYI